MNPSLKYKYHRERENTSVEIINNKIYELEPLNNKMIHFHDFRPHVKKKWLSNHLKFP